MSVNAYFDYDFDEDTESQADEIVHEAKDKLVDLIYKNVKSEIEEDAVLIPWCFPMAPSCSRQWWR